MIGDFWDHRHRRSSPGEDRRIHPIHVGADEVAERIDGEGLKRQDDGQVFSPDRISGREGETERYPWACVAGRGNVANPFSAAAGGVPKNMGPWGRDASATQSIETLLWGGKPGS